MIHSWLFRGGEYTLLSVEKRRNNAIKFFMKVNLYLVVRFRNGPKTLDRRWYTEGVFLSENHTKLRKTKANWLKLPLSTHFNDK